MESNYEQMVKALRHCMAKEDSITICEPCSYYGKGIECENVLHTDAAAAIEELEDALADECSENDYLVNENTRLTTENKELQAQLPKQGKWIYKPKDAIEMMFTLPKCSVCGHESSDANNYCPNCGAKMEVQDGQ